jgi:hypothetical protein
VRYHRLFDLQVRHAGYPEGRCRHLRIEPRSDHASGERSLARHRFLARARAQGLQVLANVEEHAKGHRLTLPPRGELTLGFEVRVEGHEFASTTDLSSWTGLSTPLYRNIDPDIDGDNRVDRVHSSLQLVGDAGVPARPGVAALIEITGLDSGWLAAPPSFTLELEPRASLWVYYLLTKRPQSEAPRISDADAKPIHFTRKQITAANTSPSSDPTGVRLLQRNPEHRCWRLVSKRAIAWQQAARRHLALYLGDELLIRELAAPSSNNSTIVALTRTKPRESLYRVVMY